MAAIAIIIACQISVASTKICQIYQLDDDGYDYSFRSELRLLRRDALPPSFGFNLFVYTRSSLLIQKRASVS